MGLLAAGGRMSMRVRILIQKRKRQRRTGEKEMAESMLDKKKRTRKARRKKTKKTRIARRKKKECVFETKKVLEG